MHPYLFLYLLCYEYLHLTFWAVIFYVSLNLVAVPTTVFGNFDKFREKAPLRWDKQIRSCKQANAISGSSGLFLHFGTN